MTHPSIQGLREAVRAAACVRESVRGPGYDDPAKGRRWVCGYDRLHPECMEAAQTAYLTEHGVLLSGEGLVRAEWSSPHSELYRLAPVPVPQDGET